MTVLCPCCGSLMNRPPFPQYLVDVPPTQGRVAKRIIRTLADAYPDGVTGADLIKATHFDYPTATSDNLRPIINRLRKQLRAHGWTIPQVSAGSRSPRYGLMPIEAAT
jgi:hypothetical protein